MPGIFRGEEGIPRGGPAPARLRRGAQSPWPYRRSGADKLSSSAAPRAGSADAVAVFEPPSSAGAPNLTATPGMALSSTEAGVFFFASTPLDEDFGESVFHAKVRSGELGVLRVALQPPLVGGCRVLSAGTCQIRQ